MRISQRTLHALITVALVLLANLSAEAASLVAGVSPVTAKLTIPDAKVLPGVPFDMWIDVTNASDATVGVGLCGDMLVKPETGASFTVLPPASHGTRPDYPVLLPEYDMAGAGVTYLLLRPHKSQTLTLPILPSLTGPAYFTDPRLSGPGSYTISFRLDYCWPGSVTPQKSLLPATFLGPVTTNEVTIERITPSGDDASVWRRMQELTTTGWSPIEWSGSTAGKTIRNEIKTKYPASNYYPYVVLAEGGPADALQDAIDHFPDSPTLEYLRYQLAITTKDGIRSAALRAVAEQATRPTTRILIFGREDVKRPCPQDYDCSEP